MAKKPAPQSLTPHQWATEFADTARELRPEIG
jgi:hypothetical protein